jgi:hypothetical protein
MKRIIAILLSALTVFMFASCGQSGASGSNTKLEWPDSELAKMLPVPKSELGEIDIDSADTLMVSVSETSKDDYRAYVKDCKSKGFTVDYYSSDDYFSAENKDGFSISVDYNEKKKIMDISAYTPRDIEEETSAPKTSSKAKSKSSSKVKKSSATVADTSLRDMLDDYEAFVKKYVAFMKKYKESDDVLSMLSDYSQMVADLADWSEKIEAVNEDELSSEDAAYYAEVAARCSKLLLEAAVS